MLELAVVVFLIVLNAFFAMSEMALMTSRKLRLKQMAETSRGARTALLLAEHPDQLLSTVQIGITLIGVLTGVFGGESIGLAIAGWLGEGMPLVREYAQPIGIGTAVGLITAGSVIFGELVPKRLALTNPERIACAVALPLYGLSRAARPAVLALGAINRGVLRLLGLKDDARAHISEEEIRLLVSESHEQGVIDADERKMVYRVLSLGDRTVESLMTPRTRIAWLDAAAPLADNLAVMRETPFSRYPVYRESDRDVLGILEVKSLLEGIQSGAPALFDRLRKPLFVSESTHALKLLEIFREEQQSLALVVDEYGDIAGLVTVNDVLTAVLGRIQSPEGDEDENPVVHRADGSLLVDGALPREDLRELLGGGRLPGEDEHDYHTAAGMVIARFGRIPHVGEAFDWDGWRIEVVDLDGPRVDKLLLRRAPSSDDDPDATAG
ncbi:hemolysin family protein [Vulcaniibacterium thermophilum]|jgi:putative hemolysin|uniref:Hemolysin n=1 Tax=Vulcaniibacterium thermophilum TaxID=1169913 RepID=A0A918YUM5_9GAMM|nr:hemolysin family protein [Vulcaniibacterium thermophilum]GHE25235.1 hemolysin [Vulcaniibacterium thermophilum]